MNTNGEQLFSVTVEGVLTEDGIWQINVCVRYRDGMVPKPGDPLLGDARLAVFQAIASEGRRGRALGATRAAVNLDMGDPSQEIILEELIVGLPITQ